MPIVFYTDESESVTEQFDGLGNLQARTVSTSKGSSDSSDGSGKHQSESKSETFDGAGNLTARSISHSTSSSSSKE